MSLVRVMYRIYLYSVQALVICLCIPMNAIFALMLKMWWHITGIQATIARNAQDPTFYGSSAQILKCWAKIKISPLPFLGRLHFVLTHERFCHPSYVLGNDVTLADLNDKEAIFVEKERHCSPATNSSFVLLALGQLATTKRVIIVPMPSFMKLADEVLQKGLPKVIFVHNHARCGSTMLCSMFEHTQRVICLCEPGALASGFKMAASATDIEERNQILQAVVAILTKPTKTDHGERPLAYVIKPRLYLAERMNIFCEVFPSCVHLFLYRNPVLSCRSNYRMMSSALLLQILKTVGDIGVLSVVERTRRAATGITRDSLSCDLVPKNCLEFAMILTIERFLVYKKCVGEGKDITGLCYDDLCKHPDFMLERIFHLCDLPQSLVQKAKRAMEKDAQIDSPLGRRQLARVSGPAPDFSQEFLRSMEKECKQRGLEMTRGWASLRLPGSIPSPTQD